MSDIEQCLDGNLCRCTGYRPIMDAAKSFAVDSDIKNHIGGGGACGKIEGGLRLEAEIERMFPSVLKELAQVGPGAPEMIFNGLSGGYYFRPVSVASAMDAAKNATATGASWAFICSNTSAGVYKRHLPESQVLIDVAGIAELGQIKQSETELIVGASISISSLIEALKASGQKMGTEAAAVFLSLAAGAAKIAGTHVRNAASVGGNICMSKYLGFGSDLAPLLCGANTKINYVTNTGLVTELLFDFLNKEDAGTRPLVVSLAIPYPEPGAIYSNQRTAIRNTNAHAIANCSFLLNIVGGTVTKATLVFGACGESDTPGKNSPVRATATESLLVGKTIDDSLLREAVASLGSQPIVRGSYKTEHRKRLVKAYLQKFLTSILESTPAPVQQSKPVRSAFQSYTATTEFAPIGQAVARLDGTDHASGRATYCSDIKELPDTLYAAFVLAVVPKGTVISWETPKALKMPGVVRFLSANDFPKGVSNSIPAVMPMLPPTPVLSTVAQFNGDPVGLIIARSQHQANRAARVAAEELKYETEPAVLTVAAAEKRGDKPAIAADAKKGDADAAAANADLLQLSGTCFMNSQQHFYMETNVALAIPKERFMEVHTATQAPDYANKSLAAVLGVPMSHVKVEHYRMGGSFGGKCSPQAAASCAIAAQIMGCPIRMTVDRNTDTKINGGREETSAQWKLSYTKAGKISGMTINIQKNLGYTIGLSIFPVSFIMPRQTMSMYDIENMAVTSSGYVTNLPNRTTVRSPGDIEAGFISEEIIDQVAHSLGVHSQKVREENFLTELSKGPHGEPIQYHVFTFPDMYKEMMGPRGWTKRIADTEAFNLKSKTIKKGACVVPFRYSCMVFEHSAQLSIYQDGSVVIFHSGAEMGQGLIVKAIQAAAYALGVLCTTPISLNKIRSGGNDTFALPNQPVTGGSTASEGVCKAILRAAATLVDRFRPFAEKIEPEKRTWEAVVAAAHAAKCTMFAGGHWKGEMPGPNPDTDTIAYSVFCIAGCEVTLDTSTGEVSVDRLEIKYDSGKSLNPAVDIGQVEGAFMMGLGYMLLEDVQIDPTTGALHSDGTWEYKPPTVNDVPTYFSVDLINNDKFVRGILSSKASGEPPLCIAPAINSAVRQCVNSARSDKGLKEYVNITVPYTTEKLAGACSAE